MLGKPFKGIWGVFTHLDEAASVVAKLREQGKDYSVLAPCPRHELNHAMGDPSSPIDT